MPKAGKTKVAARCVKLIHPQSRKAAKLGGREMHKERVRKVHQDTAFKNSIQIEKLKWFQEALEPDRANYSRADAEDLVERYLERFEEELEQISIVNSIKSRSGRQHAMREDVINQTKKREEEQFNTCGLEIPDICDGRNAKVLRSWDGSPKFLGNIKMRRVVRTIPDLSDFADFAGQSTAENGSAENGQESLMKGRMSRETMTRSTMTRRTMRGLRTICWTATRKTWMMKGTIVKKTKGWKVTECLKAHLH
ncbi:translation machinery-associated protein 16 [Strongylocentrotus purpuratus]|uniref:Translation machinery-associated protein 16 n=1 Tax=Strongylocentrotus purpuratus TaxID=7668 RepID=A0A7M7RCI3_STRPU|nr:translation machinery-associated protein 16 [Strongylocentrotus purpuratus]